MAYQVLTIRIPGEIRGKGRPRFSRKNGHVRTYTDERTASAETWVKCCAIDQVGMPRWQGAISLTINVAVEVPASKPTKWRAAALAGDIRPTGRPDFDNIAKLLCDALNKIVWRDDSQITDVLFTKYYAEIASAELIVREYRPAVPNSETPRVATQGVSKQCLPEEKIMLETERFDQQKNAGTAL